MNASCAMTTKTFTKIRILLDMIKFEHTLFALPFAYLGAFLAARGAPRPMTALWILGAMAGARTAAMGFNRIVDMPYDAKNPRTRDRALPKGDVRTGEAWAMVGISSAVFFLSAWQLNPLSLAVSPLVLAVVLLYSYTKRFTPLCHVFLGLAIGIAPSAGWIAVTGSIALIPVVVSAGVLFWIAGFDILYACLDADFDRACGLYSIPACFGLRRAFWISTVFHVLAFAAFVAVGVLASLNWIYGLGVAATFVLLILQRMVLSPTDLSRMNMAFFTMNAAISIILFGATALSLLLRV